MKEEQLIIYGIVPIGMVVSSGTFDIIVLYVTGVIFQIVPEGFYGFVILAEMVVAA